MSRSTISSNNIIDPINENHNELPYPVLLKPHQWKWIKKRYRITNREIEIAKLICQGLNNEQIAVNLNIKQGTVKTHVRNIYRKLWVNNKISMLLKFLTEINQFYNTQHSFEENPPDQTP